MTHGIHSKLLMNQYAEKFPVEV